MISCLASTVILLVHVLQLKPIQFHVNPVFTFQMRARRALILDDDEDEDMVYSFKVLLPNSTSVGLTLSNPGPEMPMENFVNLVKEEYDKSRKDCMLMSKRTRVDWNLGGKFLLESDSEKMKGAVRFAAFKPNLCHIIRLDVSFFFVHLFC